jgi:hypothetical protein
MLEFLRQGPARAQTPASREAADLDAAIEVAAKKAALRNLEARNAAADKDGGDAQGGPDDGEARGVFSWTGADGSTTTLTNPTQEQIQTVMAQNGADGGAPPPPWVFVAVTSILVWGAFAIAALVLYHRRKMRGISVGKESPDSAARLARIENAVESVALEVERISEGQRFTTRLLTEGPAEPVSAAAPGEANVVRAGGARG